MKPTASPEVGTAFEARAARAEALALDSAAACEPLRFAAGLCRAQGRTAAAVEALHSTGPLCGRLDDDADRLVPHLVGLLRFAAQQGPPLLAADADACARDGLVRARLVAWWQGDRTGARDYLSRALLRPYVEVLASRGVSPERTAGRGRCPFCSGAPWAAARRTEAGAASARRLLVCALCGGEWPLGRILCPACDEGDPAKLPAFQSDRYPAARIEACETCRAYVKSIDPSVDGGAVPEVDDLASLSLDLWAAGQGFTRIEPGLAGVV